MSAGTSSSASATGTGGTFSAWTLGLRGCAAPAKTMHFTLWACGGIELERVQGQGFGVDHPSSGVGTWPAPTLALTPSWLPTRHLGVMLESTLAVPLDRPTFALTGIGNVFRPAPVAGRVVLAIELRLP